MSNLWILSEESPKPFVILQILEQYQKDFNVPLEYCFKEEIFINPTFDGSYFNFIYTVDGIKFVDINNIYIVLSKGTSSFFDFLVFQQDEMPVENSFQNNLIMAVEETKTSDSESRNTGVYQRATKFIFIQEFFPSIKLYKLYNDDYSDDYNKKPSDTSIFGTNLFLTLGTSFIGKDISKWFYKFQSIEEIIDFKTMMRKAPSSNTPITIQKCEDCIYISGRLSKPKDYGNIAHDPNIGAISLIAKGLRTLGWNKRIIITQHGVSQDYVDVNFKNKFIYVCSILNLELEDIVLPDRIDLPKQYWLYETSSEKIASILLHVVCMNDNIEIIYQNHAGAERGYFKTKSGENIALPKKDQKGNKLFIPDLIIYHALSNSILIIEGKRFLMRKNGESELSLYDSLEQEFIHKYYPSCQVMRYITLYGDNYLGIPSENTLLYINQYGRVFINLNAPDFIKLAFLNNGLEY